MTNLDKILIYNPKASSKPVEANLEDHIRDFSKKKNIIVKAGTDVLTTDGHLDLEIMHNIGSQLVYLLRKDVRITYVTSAAIVAGKSRLGEKASKLSKRSLSIVGQPRLMEKYCNIFDMFKDIEIGQALLEATDFDPKHRKETKEGFDGFYNECKGLAIVNANDATWKGEVDADNDRLTAWFYQLLNADLAIYLSNVDGLKYNYKKPDEKLINSVSSVNNYILGLVGDKQSSDTTGGMDAKLRAIKRIMRDKGEAVICNGRKPNIILDVYNGKPVGTYFK